MCSAQRQVLPYSSRSKACLLTAEEGLPSFILSSIPPRGQDHHAVRYDQARLSVFCWWQIWWLSPHRHASILLRYRLCQTKKCLRLFSKTSHSSAASTSPIRLHTGSRVLQMTVFIILFFRQRLKALVSSSFLLVNAFFARAILGYNDIACNF